MGGRNATLSSGETTRLHKPGVVGSSPTAASQGDFRIDHEPAEVHHSREGISASQLKAFDESRTGFYLRHILKSAPPKTSAAMEFGTMLHLWGELGDEAFWGRAVAYPEDRLTATGQVGKAAKEWAATQPPDAILLSPSDRQRLWDQTRRILAHPRAAELIEQTVDREFNCQWTWQGHAMRCRVDGATERVWFDFKTTSDADTSNVAGSFSRFRYPLQDAVYRAARRASGMWPDEPMQFIVTSTVWPYRCSVVKIPREITDAAERKALRLLEEIKSRMDWDDWSEPDNGEVVELAWPKYLKED